MRTQHPTKKEVVTIETERRGPVTLPAGGSAGYGAAAGSRCANLNNSASETNVNIGAALTHSLRRDRLDITARPDQPPQMREHSASPSPRLVATVVAERRGQGTATTW
jgi:hypothetical protein